MGSLTAFLHTATLLFLGGLALIVGIQLLSGRIRLQSLLSPERRGRAEGTQAGRSAGALSPSRLLLLVVALGVASYLLAGVLLDPSGFAPVPPWVLILFVGSHLLHLAGKLRPLRPRTPR